MSIQVVVPTAELAEAVGPVTGAEFTVWNGDGDALTHVDLWVPDYSTHPSVIDRVQAFGSVGAVQLQTAGYDGVPERMPAGVSLHSAVGVHDDATAEHAVGMTLAVLRGIPESVRNADTGTWVRMPGRQSLADARVMILGYGSIGRAVAERLVPMKAHVTGVATRPRPDDVVGQVRGFDELDALLPKQDVVIVLVPHNAATDKLVDASFLAKMADGALLVNVARGGVADTDAILAEAGRLRFALDVTDPEPLPDGHPLFNAPGVLITPHVAGGTTAMLPRMAAVIRAQVTRLVAGEPLAHVVHPV
ncbi:2-hydroxyacid dehydrogenase [Nocardioides yefusunii]|uniref:2-hydroxyacid dehydrogenase n=1 Tax=Nocardioides yefusunii TaxID=2500546 RepID=A0ABW1QVL0_9ACTN|nr:2-hydroxyacid dehydrogenase [Nocardioides yefusunii]